MLPGVGGPSWRLQIDPKKVQDRIHSGFEEDRTIRGEQKRQKKQKRAPNPPKSKPPQHFWADLDAQRAHKSPPRAHTRGPVLSQYNLMTSFGSKM